MAVYPYIQDHPYNALIGGGEAMGLAGLDGHKEQSALNYGTVEMGIWETTSNMLKRDRKTKMP